MKKCIVHQNYQEIQYHQDINVKERKKQAKKVKNQAKEINDQKKIETRSYLNEFEQKALSLNNIYDFMELLYDKPIKGKVRELKKRFLTVIIFLMYLINNYVYY